MGAPPHCRTTTCEPPVHHGAPCHPLGRSYFHLRLTLTRASCSVVERFFYSSSACCYPEHIQDTENMGGRTGLREEDAWPAAPQDGYGLEKLYAEEICKYYAKDFGFAVRIARFHNIYGVQLIIHPHTSTHSYVRVLSLGRLLPCRCD